MSTFSLLAVLPNQYIVDSRRYEVTDPSVQTKECEPNTSFASEIPCLGLGPEAALAAANILTSGRHRVEKFVREWVVPAQCTKQVNGNPIYVPGCIHLEVVVRGDTVVRELVLRSSLGLCQKRILAPSALVLKGKRCTDGISKK